MRIHSSWNGGRVFLFSTLITYVIFFLFMALFFRNVRDTLPLPKIDESGIVGYSQYFGYPFFIDTLLFFAMVVIPLIVFLSLEFIYMVKKNKR